MHTYDEKNACDKQDISLQKLIQHYHLSCEVLTYFLCERRDKNHSTRLMRILGMMRRKPWINSRGLFNLYDAMSA